MAPSRVNGSLVKSYLGREFTFDRGDTYNYTINYNGCGSIWGGGFGYGYGGFGCGGFYGGGFYGGGCCCSNIWIPMAINAGMNLAGLIFGRK